MIISFKYKVKVDKKADEELSTVNQYKTFSITFTIK